MFTLNSKYYNVVDTRVSIPKSKGVAIFNEYTNESDVGVNPPDSVKMCPFDFISWGESSIENLDITLPTLETDWATFDRDLLPTYFQETKTLAERRTAVSDQIKAYRDGRSNNGGYTTAGKWFHSNQSSRTQQISLTLLGAALDAMSPPLQWKTMDGSFIAMTSTLAAQIFQAAVTQDSTTFAVAEVHLAAVAVSTDPESYDYTTGWPTIYGE